MECGFAWSQVLEVIQVIKESVIFDHRFEILIVSETLLARDVGPRVAFLCLGTDVVDKLDRFQIAEFWE